MTTFKSFRILIASAQSAETWHTASGCSCAPVFRITSLYSFVCASYTSSKIKSAICSIALKIADSRFQTSIDDISASTGPSDPSFGDVFRAVLVYMCFKFRVNRPTRSLAVRRGFEPCRRLETGYRASSFNCDISASSAATELGFREDIPV